MSLLSDLASGTSVLLFGPPAPVQKDPVPSTTPSSSPAITALPSPPTTSIKAALLRPNLGLSDRKADIAVNIAKADELPLPPPPEQDSHAATASSLLISTGASAISFLGSAVLGIGSAAVSALSSAPGGAVKDAQAEQAEESTVLGSISNALLSRAVSVRDAAIDSVTASASSLASTAANAITSAASTVTTSSHSPPTPDPPAVRRASTLPIQYTTTGEPFSSDPSISAMQRIPDHPCGHTPRQGLTHCCSAPDVLSAQQEENCTCKCNAADSSSDDTCECVCHTKTYAKGQSGHFHRVEQLVKGTKRVVRDIKNVL